MEKQENRLKLIVNIKYSGSNAIIFLGRRDVYEGTLNYKFKKVYCIRLKKDKLVLDPAPNQANPRENSCFRAIIYKNKEKYMIMRISYTLMKILGKPEKAYLYIEDDKIILEPTIINITN